MHEHQLWISMEQKDIYTYTKTSNYLIYHTLFLKTYQVVDIMLAVRTIVETTYTLPVPPNIILSPQIMV